MSLFRTALLPALGILASLQAQTTAQITGEITDNSAAIIVDAEVSAENVSTGLRRATKSNNAGIYRISLLPAGEYRVTVKKEGFRPVRRSNVMLSVEQTARLDFVIEVGDIVAMIEVSSAAPMLETESATIGTTVGRRAVAELPLVSAVSGRDPVELLQVLPGSTNRGVAGTQSINGGRIGTNDIQVDGATKTEELIGNSSGAGGIPSVETVSEVKLMTNVYSAEYGRSGGATVIVTTKSGTNAFSGSAYHFFRHDKLAARNFFAPVLLPLRSNQWGATIGGPIVRNRTFFFGSYEAWRFRTDFNLRTTVPTALERAGDFSQTRTAAGALVPVFDPNTTVAAGSGFVRTPFPGNRIPSSRFDPVGLKLSSFYDLPNFAGAANTNVNNFRATDSGGRDFDQYMLRLDHAISAKNNINGRFFLQNLDQKQPIFFFNAFNPGNQNQHAPNRNFTLSDTHVFSSSVLNELRFAVNRHTNAFAPKYPGDGNALIGLTGLPSPAPAAPRVNVTGYSALGNNAYGGTYQSVYEMSDIVSLNRGKHNLKIGGNFRRFHFNRVSKVGEPGQLNFSGVLTNAPGIANTGNAIADLLLGQPVSASVTISPTFGLRSWYAAGFVQDDWKIARSLTLNLGLRYDIEAPFSEVADRLSIFDPTLKDPITGLPGAMRFAGRDGSSSQLVNTDYNNWGPRFGFAWSPQAGRFGVVRGGYGLVYSPLTRGAVSTPALNAGFSATTTFVSLDNLTAPFTLRQGFPFYVLPASSPTAQSQVGQSVTYVNPENRVPYVQQWSFGVERQLPGSFVLDASYVGNKGTKLPWGSAINLNQLRSSQLTPATLNRVANPFAGLIAGSLGGATITQGQLMRAYPQYLNVNDSGRASANSTYHSLQVKAERRMAQGLYVISSYTWSKLLTDSSDGSGGVGGVATSLQDGYNLRAEKGLSTSDLTHRFVFAGLYDLPFGRGRRWVTRGWAEKLAGGWQINSILSTQVGMPLTLTAAQNLTQSLGGGSRPNRSCNGALNGDSRSILQWFDRSCFTAAPQHQFGNSGVGILRGPGMFNVDLSLFKTIAFTDRFRLQFRAEAFNVANHTNFGLPGLAVGVGTLGVISSTAGSALDPVGGPRIVQLALKLMF